MRENAKNYAKYLTKRVKYAIISVLMSVFKFATKPFGIQYFFIPNENVGNLT